MLFYHVHYNHHFAGHDWREAEVHALQDAELVFAGEPLVPRCGILITRENADDLGMVYEIGFTTLIILQQSSMIINNHQQSSKVITYHQSIFINQVIIHIAIVIKNPP